MAGPDAILDQRGLRRARIALRAASDADLGFLRDVFASTRTDDMAMWPAAARASFVDSQFALQHRHFVEHHSAGDFWIVLHRDLAVGRLYLDRTGPVWRLLDIALIAAARGGGIGAQLLRWLQHRARAAGVSGIDLHVLRDNARATRLYAKAGFVEAIGASATHRRMIWSCAVS